MNRERLEHLITILEEVERRNLAFNLSTWASGNVRDHWNLVGSLDETCGTTCCAMGWAALDPTFAGQGLSLSVSIWPEDEDAECITEKVTGLDHLTALLRANDDVDVEPHFEDRLGLGAATGFFGITWEQAEALFVPWTYGDRMHPIAPGEVVARIRRLLAGEDINAKACK